MARSCSPNNNGRILFKATKNPTFFKIILQETIDDNKMAVPKKFVRDYGHNLSNSVILKLPSGQNWKLRILKANGKIWFEKKWKEFMEFYSIIIGSFLVFRYDETISGFNVTIFDATCTEIDYPYTISNNEATSELKVPKVEQETTSEEVPVEIPAPVLLLSAGKRTEKSPVSSSNDPRKKMKKTENFPEKTGKGTNTKVKNENEQKQIVKYTRKEPSKDIHREITKFQSEIPSSQIKMQPSYLDHNKSNPRIPTSFAKKYLKSENGDAALNVMDGGTWTVKWCTGVTGLTNIMHSGWKKFVQDNHLQLSDVCNFELIDPCRMIFRVVIYRLDSTSGSSSSRKLTGKETSVVLRNTSSSNSPKVPENYPFFRVVVTSCHLSTNGVVHVPFQFFKNLKITTQDAKLLFDGKMWSVKLLLYPNSGKGVLSAGWREIVRGNSLKDGDVCTFELIDTRELLIKVSISADLSSNLLLGY